MRVASAPSKTLGPVKQLILQKLGVEVKPGTKVRQRIRFVTVQERQVIVTVVKRIRRHIAYMDALGFGKRDCMFVKPGEAALLVKHDLADMLDNQGVLANQREMPDPYGKFEFQAEHHQAVRLKEDNCKAIVGMR